MHGGDLAANYEEQVIFFRTRKKILNHKLDLYLKSNKESPSSRPYSCINNISNRLTVYKMAKLEEMIAKLIRHMRAIQNLLISE